MAAWVKTSRKAGKQYDAGRFLMEQLGAERLLNPTLMATLWTIRQQLLADLGAATAAETMLVDMADCAELRAGAPGQPLDRRRRPDARGPGVRRGPAQRQVPGEVRQGCPRASASSPVVDRLRLQLLPLFDRANRGVVRNLQALKEMRPPPAPTPMPVAIRRADQVNVAGQADERLSAPGMMITALMPVYCANPACVRALPRGVRASSASGAPFRGAPVEPLACKSWPARHPLDRATWTAWSERWVRRVPPRPCYPQAA